jgi:hypothetical protein
VLLFHDTPQGKNITSAEVDAVSQQFKQMSFDFFNDATLAPLQDLVNVAEGNHPSKVQACGSSEAPVPIADDPQVPLQALSCFVL